MLRSWSMSALSCLFLVAFVPMQAAAADRARPLREAIAVEPGATCLETATLVEHIGSWLGADAVDPDVSIEVRGSPDQPRVVAFRTLRAGHVIANRRFDPGPERCEHLHAALGLAIAMAIKASLIDELAGTPTEARPPGQEASVDANRPWAIGTNALVALAVLPDAAYGADLRIERALGHPFGVRLGLLGLASVGERFDGTPGQFDVWLVAPRVDFCVRVELSHRFRAQGCLGLSGGALYAQGRDFAQSQGSLVPWLAAVNGVDFMADLGANWSVDVAATLILPLVRPSIVVRRDSLSGSVAGERSLDARGGFLGVGPVYRF